MSCSPHSRRPGFAPIVRGARRVLSGVALLLFGAGLAFAAELPEEEAALDPSWHEPVLQRRMPPAYPDEARRAGIAGTVIAKVRVGRDGRVREVRIAHSIPALDEAATLAARRCEFAPATNELGEVESWALLPYRFDDRLAPGGRALEHADVSGDSAAVHPFERDVAALAAMPSGAPTDDDLELRQRIMAGSLALDFIPAPGRDAVRALRTADSLARAPYDLGRGRARIEWARAAHLAPWWPEPYRRVAAAALADRDLGLARRCLAIVLAGRPGDDHAEAMMRRVRTMDQLQGKEAKEKARDRK